MIPQLLILGVADGLFDTKPFNGPEEGSHERVEFDSVAGNLEAA